MISTPRTDGRSAPTPVSPERWAQIQPLIDEALDLPPELRAAFYDRACGDDAVLRSQVEKFVAACERADPFLDWRAGEGFAGLFDEPPPPLLNGRFDMEREIGRGGMAVVYRAHDRKHDRTVAVKVIGPEAAAAIGAERFDREIKVAARLQHPNIVPLYDSGDDRGWLYYVMPLIEGGSLRQRLARNPTTTIAQAVRVACDIGVALTHAHQQGIVHRDVKPENILFDDDRALLADFGIARPSPGTGSARTGGAGTPEYMSPEQAAGQAVDARSDIYSLAAVIYEMLMGEPPASSDDDARILSLRQLPEPTAIVLQRGLAIDPPLRFASAAEFAQALDDANAPPQSASAGWRRGLTAVLLIVVAGFGAYQLARPRDRHRPPAAAFDLFVRGTQQQLFRSDSGTRAAVGLLSQAVAADPTFPAAFAALSQAYNAVCMGHETRPARVVACDSAVLAAKRSIALDSSLADGYVALAWASLNRADYVAAYVAARRAVDIDPNSEDAHEFVAAGEMWRGRFGAAVAEDSRALALNPSSVSAIAELARMMAYAGNDDSALALLKPLRSLRPPVRRARGLAEEIFERRGMWAEAMAEAAPDPTSIARILALSGRTAEARVILDSLLAHWDEGRSRANDILLIYASLGDFDRAFDWLDSAIDDRTLGPAINDPGFSAFRADPRWASFKRRLGLSPP